MVAGPKGFCFNTKSGVAQMVDPSAAFRSGAKTRNENFDVISRASSQKRALSIVKPREGAKGVDGKLTFKSLKGLEGVAESQNDDYGDRSRLPSIRSTKQSSKLEASEVLSRATKLS